MKRFASFALVMLAAILFGLTPGARAIAADSSGPAEASRPSQPNTELARQLINEIHLTDMMKNMMSTMIPVMMEQERKNFPSITDKQAAVVDSAILDSSSDLIKNVIDRMIPLYASTFTEQELRDLVNFYGTPSGQAMLSKMPALMASAAPMMRDLAPKYQAEIKNRICQKLNCGSLPAPAAAQMRD